MKVLKGILIPLLVLVLLVAIAACVIFFTTPNQLRYGDKAVINGKSLNDLGFGDIRLYEIIKEAKDISEVNASSIYDTKADLTKEKENADANLDGTDVVVDGEVDYKKIMNGHIKYDKRYLKEYKEKTLAYIFNELVKSADSTAANFNTIKSMNASIKEVTINNSNDKRSVRIVMSIDVSKFQSEITKVLGAFSKVVKFPKEVFAVSYLDITGVDELNAELKLTPTAFKINDKEDVVTKAIFNVIAINLDVKGDTTAYINDKVAASFKEIVGNLGEVATTNDSSIKVNDEISSEKIDKSINAVQAHRIHIVTYKK